MVSRATSGLWAGSDTEETEHNGNNKSSPEGDLSAAEIAESAVRQVLSPTRALLPPSSPGSSGGSMVMAGTAQASLGSESDHVLPCGGEMDPPDEPGDDGLGG
jgi:hypothetical protein